MKVAKDGEGKEENVGHRRERNLIHEKHARDYSGPREGTCLSGGRGGLAPKFASEILVGAPNFASKNLNDKCPKFCPLNFRFYPKIGIFAQLLRFVITELSKIFLLFGELGRTLPKFCL